jgi:hypothetical protein
MVGARTLWRIVPLACLQVDKGLFERASDSTQSNCALPPRIRHSNFPDSGTGRGEKRVSGSSDLNSCYLFHIT